MQWGLHLMKNDSSPRVLLLKIKVKIKQPKLILVTIDRIYTHMHTHIDSACPNAITYIVNVVCIYVIYTHTHGNQCVYMPTCTYIHATRHACM